MKKIICGLDLSLNNTAIAYQKNKRIESYKFIDTSKYKKEESIKRINYIISDFIDFLNQKTNTEMTFFIEDTFLMRNKSAKQLIYLGGIIRYKLFCRKIKYYNVAPQFLKSFIIGKAQVKKGNKKQLMLKEIYKKYKVDVEDDNICDAIALLKFGECFLNNKKCINKHQENCIERYRKKNG